MTFRGSSRPRIFMGSSRIKQTVDPRLVAGTEFAPAYNGGINGSANFAEVKSFLQYYLTADKNLRHVFIEAFAPALFARRETRPTRPDPLLDAALPKNARPPMIQFGLASDLADFASVFFSVSGLKSAVRTVSVNRGQRNLPVAGPFDDAALRRSPLRRTTSASATFSILCFTPGSCSATCWYRRPPSSRRKK